MEDSAKKNILGKLIFWKKGESQTVEPDLNAVWLYLLGVFFVAALILIGLHFVLYLRISSNEIFISDKQDVPSIETIDRGELENILDDLAHEELRFQEIQMQ